MDIIIRRKLFLQSQVQHYSIAIKLVAYQCER
jgi:hypothetical protein